MKIKPISYRMPLEIKRHFKGKGIAIWWKSRRNLRHVSISQQDRLRKIAHASGINRIKVPYTISKVDFNKVLDLLDSEIQQYTKPRLILPGQVLNLRRLPASIRRGGKTIPQRAIAWVKSLYLKFLMVVYSVKVRLTSADLNIVQYPNRYGEKLVAIVDYPEGYTRDREIPWVIIPPAFGKRKETYFLLALYLKKNGFGVVRYDDSHSIGESDGEIRDLTLSRSTQNVIATLDFVSKVLKGKTIGLIPFSLSARPAIKAATLDRRVRFMLPIVGSPSVQTLLRRVYGEDLVADFAAGMRKGDLNLLGHYIDSSKFLGNTQDKGFADLASTKEDMRKINIPIVWFCGTEDPWVDPEEVREVLEINPAGVQHEVKIFPDLTHRFREAEKAHEIFAQTVRVAAQLVGRRKIKEVIRPWTGEVVERAVRERQRIQTLISKEDKVRLWTNYLEGFDVLKETDDYMGYLADLKDQLSIQPGEKLLDAGSGNGYVIEYLLGKMINDILKNKMEGSAEGEIVGLDIVPDALDRAEKIISKVKMKRRGLPSVKFLEHDIDSGKLPFEDWEFDKVVGSLLLSYLENRQAAVRELCRVLKPGGTIVLTSLKPDADVSQIWHRFMKKIEKQYSGDELKKQMDKGRDQFFKAVGWIENMEEQGEFKYFSAAELRSLLRENGITDIKIIKSFGGQAVIVAGRKPS